jgi:putative ABC transport system permease protein
MFNYYLSLALRSLKRNVVLTTLMVAAIGVGIGASMTVFTVLRTMSGDPIPSKSSQLFVPMIDNWGPKNQDDVFTQDQVSYKDVMAWWRDHRGKRQTPEDEVGFSVMPQAPGATPFSATARAVGADFFAMFEVPFRSGVGWTAADDQDRANVVVIGAKLADRLYPHGDAVGHTINLDEHDYRINGVLAHWDPQPRFYDASGDTYAETEDVYLPFLTAIDRHMETHGNNNCFEANDPGWDGHLNSECVWLGYWVELPDAAAVSDYRQYLVNYSVEQKKNGRFNWDAKTFLRDVPEWLDYEKVVPSEMRVSSLVAGGFLLVCLVNSIGLMLAKLSGRSAELGVRRALGASKAEIFVQCIVESAVVGLVGGLLGLGLTMLGLMMERSILSEELARLAHLNAGAVVITIALSVLATMCSGLYPSWRASRVQPAWQLKAQ